MVKTSIFEVQHIKTLALEIDFSLTASEEL